MPRRSLVLLPVMLALGACGGDPPPAPDATTAEAPAPAQDPDAVDWRDCRFQGLSIPVPGKVFVVDAGAPLPDTEPGRETIRRVEVLVPGPVSLLLTASDATAWSVRPSQETQIVAVFASGPAPQRITGPGLGPHRLERSTAFGQACGRYWMADGLGPQVAEASDELFGRGYDAAYRMRIDTVVIGGTQPSAELLGR